MKRNLFKFINAAKKAPGKKHHLDFIAALLTIPVLLSVIIINYSNLQNLQKNKANGTPSPTQTEKIIVVPDKSVSQTQTITPAEVKNCTKDIGPIDISTPQEGSINSDNPINFIIDYADNSYCSVVWSYRINNSQWSSYTSNNPIVYNLPKGNIKFELKVQSTVIQKEKIITRNFINNFSGTPAASSSATTN